MQKFDEFYQSQVVNESLKQELMGLAMTISLAMTMGIGLNKVGIIQDVDDMRRALRDAQNQGYDTQEIIQKAQQPQVIEKAKEILQQKQQQTPKPPQEQHLMPPEPTPQQKMAAAIRKPEPIQQPQSPKQLRNVKDVVADILKELGAYSPQAHAVMLANIRGEAGSEMKPRSENLNYSAKGLLSTFSKYFTPKTAKQYERKPEMIANKVYGNRLGNDANEGYKYRGRGYFQITGKENYERMSKLVGVDLVENPDLVNDPEISEKILKAQIAEMLKRGVNLKSIESVTKFIGPAKLSERVKQRREWYKQFLPHINDAKAVIP